MEGKATDKEFEDLGFTEKEKDDLERVDYNASQEQVSFGTMVKKAEKGELDSNKVGDLLRRCHRLEDREDCKIEDRARERAAGKDHYGEQKIPTILTSSNNNLHNMASEDYAKICTCPIGSLPIKYLSLLVDKNKIETRTGSLLEINWKRNMVIGKGDCMSVLVQLL